MGRKNRDINGERYFEASRHNAATRRAYQRERRFIGVDGEGGNVPEEGTLFGTRHQYLSLRAGPDLLETGKPLSWDECLRFLSGLDPDHIYVSYFFDYDVTMILRTMPEERVRRLLYPVSRETSTMRRMPIDVGDYQIDYLPHKEFKVRRREDGARWVTISDTGQFFQTSFLKTLEKWNIGTPDEQEMIRKGKLMRADFAESNEEIRAYNALECLLLEQLMSDFRAVCEETGYVPRKWQGPGYLASALLERHGVPRRDDIPILQNEQFRALAQAGYYGGRFETTAAGPIRGRVWQYDINGAYVHLLRGLSCLTHGSWRRVHQRPDHGIWFGQVHFDHSTYGQLYNLPVRDKNGNIFYPKEGNGVYWSPELVAAERAGTVLAFDSGWVYEAHCDCRWFDFVDPMYAERKRLGKSTKGYVLKLGGNSIYGKLAQSIGYAPWANPVWAGLITAGCRAMLIDAYSQAPEACYMLATDGLFMGAEIEVPVSDALGDWELTVHDEGIFIVQPGIYFTGEEPKSRGVEKGKIDEMRSEFEAQFQKFVASRGLDHTVGVPVDNFITAKQALQRNKWALAGTWEKMDREISFSWASKRKSGLARTVDGILRTLPHNGGPDLHSVPYARQIGGNLRGMQGEEYSSAGLAESARIGEQPDWVQPMLTDRE